MPRIVGKSAGWKGPVEEYTRNKGSVGRRKIVFVGASYKFVHRVFRDMLLVGGFNDCEVVVHDLDPEPMKLVGDLVERMARQKRTRVAVTRTLDRAAALKDADVVLLSITTGGQESDFRSFEVCAKYGIPVGVGDTLGPTALARNLREIPVVVELVREMERLCPKAVLLNFTNPMSCITGAAARYSSIPVYGLCHSADALFQYFAEIFGCKKKQVTMELGGVNHQAFVTRLWIRGKERTGDILAASLASGAKVADSLIGTQEEVKLQQDICRVLGAWPSCGGTHLAEFYHFFFTPRRIGMFDEIEKGIKKLIPGRQPFGRREPPAILREWAYGPEPVGDMHLLTSEHAHELMWAHLTGEPFTRALNVLNTGEFIRGLPRDACVEVMATVAGRKLTATPIALPPAVHSLVQRWVTIHQLSIRAAMDCDREAAQQALFLDPHVGDLYDIPLILDDFLKCLEPWLPRGWYGR